MPRTSEPDQVPPEVAAFLDGKRAKPAWDHLDVWHEEHAVSFAIAKLTEQSLLETMHEAVKDSIKNGEHYDDFAKRVTPILQKAGWWGRDEEGNQLGSPSRLRLIIETNTRTARAAGAWKRIESSKRALPYLEYRLGSAHEHRPEHVHTAEAPTVLPVDHPYWDYGYPPTAWNCHCWVRQITRADFGKLGSPEPPEGIEPFPVANKKTGEVVMTVPGVDPSFAFNAGKDRWGGLKKLGVVPPKPAPKPKTPTPQEVYEKHLTTVASDFDSDEYAKVRANTRAAVQQGLNLVPRPGTDPKQSEIEIGSTEGAAYLDWDGTVVVDFATADVAVSDPVWFTATMVHEEIHAHGSLSIKNYQSHDASQQIEEISTEILARKVIRGLHSDITEDLRYNLVGDAGPYGSWIADAVDTLTALTGLPRNLAADLVEVTSLRYKQDSREDVTDLTEQWVRHTGLTAADQVVLLEAFRTRWPKEPGQ